MTKKSYVFSDISFKILNEIAEFDQIQSQEVFKEWFDFKYEINKFNEEILRNLIKNNFYYIDFYSELQLSLHFNIPLLNRINFYGDNYREWFQEEIKGIINGHELKGNLDFMIASGKKNPERPYFFIQEFKKSSSLSKHPRGQLFAQMAVAIENNKINKMRGAYNIGRFWFFIVIEKINASKYKYHESKAFDSLDIEHLKQIFVILKAVKHKYCK